MKVFSYFFLIALLASVVFSLDCQHEPLSSYPYCNSNLDWHTRATDLVARLTTQVNITIFFISLFIFLFTFFYSIYFLKTKIFFLLTHLISMHCVLVYVFVRIIYTYHEIVKRKGTRKNSTKIKISGEIYQICFIISINTFCNSIFFLLLLLFWH